MSTLQNSASRYVVVSAIEDYAFIGRETDVAQDLDEARGFSSRLSAERWMETNGVDMGLWRAVKRDSVVVRPKRLEIALDLERSDPLAAVRELVDLHWEYCNRLETWLSRAGVGREEIDARGRPTPYVTVLAPKWAGVYSSQDHSCHYPLPYAMLKPIPGFRDSLRNTVAHEVVHAYQRLFTGCPSGHGPDFYALMKRAAEQEYLGEGHHWSIEEAQQLSSQLLPWWQQSAEKGLLASLPCEVVTVKIKRRGVQ